MTPSSILDIFAAIMLVVAAVSAARLVVDRPWRRGIMDADIDAAHLLMGIAMAGMLVASLARCRTASGRRSSPYDGLVRLVRLPRVARGRGARVLVDSHHAPHLVHSAAMVYMFAAISTPTAGHGSGMSGMGGLRAGDADAERAGGGVHLRAPAGRLFGDGPGPAVRPRPARTLPRRRRPAPGRRAPRWLARRPQADP